jgi:hypothetical protein
MLRSPGTPLASTPLAGTAPPSSSLPWCPPARVLPLLFSLAESPLRRPVHRRRARTKTWCWRCASEVAGATSGCGRSPRKSSRAPSPREARRSHATVERSSTAVPRGRSRQVLESRRTENPSRHRARRQSGRAHRSSAPAIRPERADPPGRVIRQSGRAIRRSDRARPSSARAIRPDRVDSSSAPAMRSSAPGAPSGRAGSSDRATSSRCWRRATYWGSS